MRGLWLLILMLAIVSPLFAQSTPDATTKAYPVRARTAPGYAAPLAYTIPAETAITPLALAPDTRWIQVRYAEINAWVAASSITLRQGLALPLLATAPQAPELEAENCIAVVGDSVAHGDVVFIIPGHGFAIVRTTPFSNVLDDVLQQAGLGYMDVIDRSASAVYLSDTGKNPYQNTDTYQSLLTDDCRFTIILPWINDMSLERDDNAAAYATDLTAFVETLTNQNPDGYILILGFYSGDPSEFAERHAPGYITENVIAFNAALSEACESDAQLARFAQVICMETATLFAEGDNQHVVLETSRANLDEILYEPLPPDVQPMFGAFWGDNPQGVVLGDGVHLSELGKQILGEALLEKLLSINPNL